MLNDPANLTRPQFSLLGVFGVIVLRLVLLVEAEATGAQPADLEALAGFPFSVAWLCLAMG